MNRRPSAKRPEIEASPGRKEQFVEILLITKLLCRKGGQTGVLCLVNSNARNPGNQSGEAPQPSARGGRTETGLNANMKKLSPLFTEKEQVRKTV